MEIKLTDEQVKAIRDIIEVARTVITEDDEPLLPELEKMFK